MLYGFLGKKFGRVHRYDVKTSNEAVKALAATIEGFKEVFIEGGYYRVLRGGKQDLTLEETLYPQSDQETIRIIPVVSGSKNALTSIIFGAALIWSGAWLAEGLSMGAAISASAWGAVAGNILIGMGTSLIMGGVSQLLFAPPRSNNGPGEAASNTPSYAFDGPVNTINQGNPVPVCYGRLRVGSQVISAGLSTEQI